MRRYAIFFTVLLAANSAFAQKQMKPKSKGEETAIRAVLGAQDPQARIAAADALITKYADTDFKGFALYLEAEAYSQLGNNEKAIVYGEQTLEADPKNYQAAVLLAKLYASGTKSTDLDKEEKLTKAAKYGAEAIELLKTAEKPNPQMTDPEWEATKNDFAGQAYFALGVNAAFHNKMDEANTDFAKVAEMDVDAVDLIRAGRVLLDLKKYEPAVKLFEAAAAHKNANDQIKQIANNDKARAAAMLPKK